MDDVVTSFLRDARTGEVLLLRRSDDTGSYSGRWGAVSGYVECEDEREDAEREIREETGIRDAFFVRRGDAFVVEDDEYGDWRVHPLLYDAPIRDVDTNYETERVDRCAPTEILRRQTVPRLWDSYAAVAPSVGTVAEDDEHGSAYVAARALEVLRDTAATGTLDEAREKAREFVDARPSMAVVGNRVARAAVAETADEMEKTAHAAIAEGYRADEEAAEEAAARLGDPERVVTLSRSGTVAAALNCIKASVTVAESLPGGEGAAFADEVAADRVVPDACIAGEVRDADAVVVGADAVLPDGAVVNKVGTLAAALAADRFGVPSLVVASTDKISPDADHGNEHADHRGERVPVFERVPADLVEPVTEDETLSSGEIRERADEHGRRRSALR
jgi:translation initiation factor 2B subunit (eIF-2B alpha/beta/delta family)/8-oxo-dGTP pyrophosphatase MutT (NUDIX family)